MKSIIGSLQRSVLAVACYFVLLCACFFFQDARGQTLHVIRYIPGANTTSNFLKMYNDSAVCDSVWTALTGSGYIGDVQVRYAEKDTSVILNANGRYVYGVQASVYGEPNYTAPTVTVLSLGNPIAANTAGCHAKDSMKASKVDTLTTGITGPDVPRTITVTGSASGITGNVVITAPVGGVSTTLTIALNGTSTVSSTVAIDGTPTQILIPARVHTSGDSVSVGYGDKIGLEQVLIRPSVFMTVENTTSYGSTLFTQHTDPSSEGANYITFHNASDGTGRYVYYIKE